MPSLTRKKASLKVSINSARDVYEEITKKIKIKKTREISDREEWSKTVVTHSAARR